MIIDLSLYEKTIQPSYRPLLFNKSRILLLCGGAGSGKSYFAAQKMVYRSLSEPNSFNIVIRKTSKSHRISTFPLILKIIDNLGFTSFTRVNKTDLTIEFLHPFNSKIVFIGCDDNEKLKSLIDPTSIFIEEATELTLNDFNQINTRLRGNNSRYLQIILSTNPVGGTSHWIYKMFYSKKHPQASVFKSTVLNNQYIDKEYLKTLQIQAEQNPDYGKIYLEGDWTNPEGQVFTNYKTISINQFPKRFDWICYSIDWGYNDPTAIVKVCYHDKNLYIKEELYQTHLTTDEIIDILKNDIKPNRIHEEIVCDSAEPDRIKALNNAGFNAFGANKGPNSIIRGIDILKSHNLYIDEDSQNIINELSCYIWKKDANNKIIESPSDVFNHAIDAIRYVALHKLNNEIDKNIPILVTNIDVKPI